MIAALGDSEYSKLVMALDDVAILRITVVVCQRGLHRKVHHRRIANTVPAIVDEDGAVVGALKDVARELHRDVFLNPHCIGVHG